MLKSVHWGHINTCHSSIHFNTFLLYGKWLKSSQQGHSWCSFLHSTETTHMVTYVTMSRTCWTCSKKAASKMHFMLLLTKTLRKISRVGAGAAELHNWSSAALHSWLNQIELWESSIFMQQCHNLVWLLLLMFSTIIVGRGLSPDSVPYSFGATTGFQSISAGILSFRRVSSQNPTQSQKAALFANTSQLPR